MTSKEFGVLANVLKTIYPKENLFATDEATEIWYGFLKDLDYKVASAAVQKWISTNKWSPTIADIRQIALEATVGEIPDWGNGWMQVKRAISRYGHPHPELAMESFDDITRAVVERLGFINLCMSEDEDHDRANFRMIYEEVAKRKVTELQTPPAVREHIKKLADSLSPKQIGANNEA